MGITLFRQMGTRMEARNNLRSLDQPERDLVTRKQLTEHSKIVRSAVIANLVNAAIILTLFAEDVSVSGLVTWCTVFAMTTADRLWLGKISSNRDLSSQKMLQVKRRITINAVVFAHVWGVGVAYLLPISSPTQLMLLAVIGAGKMSAGVMSYRHLPEASRAWTIVIATCLSIGLLFLGGTESYLAICLLATFAMILLLSGRQNFASFADEIFAQKELSESAETVKLLLNDFEEQSSDWLFAVDRGGYLSDVCERFAEAAHSTVEELNGSSLVSLFDRKEDRLKLTKYISQGESFPALMVTLTINNEQHWWKISGRATKEGTEDHGIAMRGVISDITAQKAAEEKVRYMAHFDGLTDLPNRRFFSEALNRTVHQAEPENKIALLLFDLDHFKAINDTLGHPIGDKFLKLVARRLENIAKSEDTLARIGGDEFALLLNGDRAGFSEEIAKTVVTALSKPFLIDGHNVVSSASVGLAQWSAELTEPETLVKYADLALYSAKGAGRNRVAIFEQQMDIVAEERRNLELDLRASLAEQEMRLHYQPVVDLKTLDQIGFEALLRWEHPRRGVVMPNEFISVAEETGLIVQLGEWVIRKALEDAAQWDEALSVAVNLSPSQMRSPNLIPTIVNALAQTGIAPGRLELEITESILMQDSDVNIRTLHNLRELGVRISLDDFGTGFSSLNYLRSFPFDKIKIDRCFVNEIDSRKDCRAIVRSVISLAKNLGMTTTAEGVERQEQVEDLRSLGCDHVQGYLYGKAEALDNCTDLRPAEKWMPRVQTVPLPAIPVAIEAGNKRKSA